MRVIEMPRIINNQRNLFSRPFKNNMIFSKASGTSLLSAAILLVTSMFLSACATPVGEVASWPVTNANESMLTGTVVDVLCELNGNCVDNCGNGRRQLAIKTEDSRTVLVSKNLNDYAGAADDLSLFCDQVVDVNGLFTEHKGVRFFQVQNIKPPGGQWQKATRFLQVWSERTGKPLSQASNWQDNDDRVQEIIKRDGVLGLGTEADQEFLGK